jgi:hypothetical protein
MQLLGNVKAIFEEDCKNQLLNYQEKYKWHKKRWLK